MEEKDISRLYKYIEDLELARKNGQGYTINNTLLEIIKHCSNIIEI